MAGHGTGNRPTRSSYLALDAKALRLKKTLWAMLIIFYFVSDSSSSSSVGLGVGVGRGVWGVAWLDLDCHDAM